MVLPVAAGTATVTVAAADNSKRLRRQQRCPGVRVPRPPHVASHGASTSAVAGQDSEVVLVLGPTGQWALAATVTVGP